MTFNTRAIGHDMGTSLIEALIALCLFSLGMLAILQLSVGLIKGNNNSKLRHMALQLAQNKMEVLLSTDYGSVVDGYENGLSATEMAASGRFDREVQVTESTAPTYKNVRVTVTWHFSGEHHVTLLSSVASP